MCADGDELRFAGSTRVYKVNISGTARVYQPPPSSIADGTTAADSDSDSDGGTGTDVLTGFGKQAAPSGPTVEEAHRSNLRVFEPP